MRYLDGEQLHSKICLIEGKGGLQRSDLSSHMDMTHKRLFVCLDTFMSLLLTVTCPIVTAWPRVKPSTGWRPGWGLLVDNGGHMVDIWLTYGGHMVDIWWTYDGHMVTIWWTYGGHTV